MKIRIERDSFADVVSWVLRSVGSRATLPVLGGILIDASGDQITLSGTDLEISGVATVSAGVEQPGRVLLPGRVLGDIARSLPEGTVSLTADGGQGKISCGEAEFVLRTLPVEDFPQIATPSGDAGTVDAKLFATAVNQATKASSHDEARPILTGVLLEISSAKVTLVATDSYRLAVREIEWAGPSGEARRVVPARALLEAVRAAEGEGEVRVWIGENQVGVASSGRSLTTRLIEGEFPNWRQLVPNDLPNALVISREGFLEAVKRVGILAQQGSPLRLELAEGGVKLASGTQDLGDATEHVAGTYTGEPATVAFNPTYLADGLQACTSAEVRLGVRDGLKPALLSAASSDGFTYLLMPVRIS
jgi:DNA polymerase-3 subunit beta